MESYNSNEGAKNYIDYLNSPDGKMFQDIIFKAVSNRLSPGQKTILDAACGNGWLAGKLANDDKQLSACDASVPFIEYGKQHFPKVKFAVADLTNLLPYGTNEFDVVILSMAAHDVVDQKKVFQNINTVLKPGGKLLVTIVNPYYGFPVAVWKRGILGRLLNKKPKLKLRPYHDFTRNENKKFVWNKVLTHYFYSLPEHINSALSAGFNLSFMEDLKSDKDSSNYDFNYRLYRFPIILLLELTKK
jgi:SAM-dependent methyltransferase